MNKLFFIFLFYFVFKLNFKDQKNQRKILPQTSTLLTSNINGTSSNVDERTESNINGLSISKTTELHRACSIPAIIVGEIPKLIVTSSTDNQSKPLSSTTTLLDTRK